MSKGSVDDGVVFHAGFPNAAEDERFGSLSLDDIAVRRRSSTFFWRLDNDVPELLWTKGSVLVVDRSLEAGEGRVLVAVDGDDFLLVRSHGKRLYRFDGTVLENDAVVWGVVTYCLQKV
jgi:hypothetical protein